MLDRLRGRIASASLRLGKAASRVMPSPTAWTVLGLALSLVAAFFFSRGTAHSAAIAGLALLGSGFLDIVDGSVARATARVSKRGSFLDSTLDRIGEAAIYFGILAGGYSPPFLVLLALALSLLVSYTRAKADSLQVSLAGVGIGERSERLIVLILASLFGLVSWGVIVVAALAAVTFVERVARVTGSLK
ncbi:MAG: CDP-alcohol phosphatidyltransferase family protein [Thaumarchaeota archaeon]|nr:CDP-alcohol phosphatidyltransferase family protein [Nitrososphaerota archaeon]